ncbi:MAG: hypothetical protein ACPL1K_06115 [Candidatus Kryptoniota bacterium]
MFYSFDYRVGFIHIPRTGGCAISLAFRPYLYFGSGWDLGVRRHLSAKAMTALLGADAPRLRWFGVYRPFAEILESLQRLIELDRQRLLPDKVMIPSPWRSVLEHEDPIKYMFQRNQWPMTEKEWYDYWTSGLPVRLLNFHNLREELDVLCKEWSLPNIELPTERVN